MQSPITLIKWSLIIASILTGLFLSLLLIPPYTGFMLEENKTTGKMTITKLDSWVSKTSMALGDNVISISSNGQVVQLQAKHILHTSYQKDLIYENRKERLKEFRKIHRILSQDKVAITFTSHKSNKTKTVALTLDQHRPLISISMKVWLAFLISISAPLMGALLWAWQPNKIETQLLFLSGIGFFFATFQGAANILIIDMYYPSNGIEGFLKIAKGAGIYSCLGFGIPVLFFYPQRIPNADILAKCFGLCLIGYAIYTFFDDWETGLNWVEQTLYFSSREVQKAMVACMIVIILLSIKQWQLSQNRPVEKAQVLWVIFSWTFGPGVFFVIFLVPKLMEVETFFSINWNNFSILSTYILVLIGVARFKLFDLEQYIQIAMKWSAISILFFVFELIFVLNVYLISSAYTLLFFLLLVAIYLPARHRLFQKLIGTPQQKHQPLINESVVQMVNYSLSPSQNPQETWLTVLRNLFSPVSITKTNQNTNTTMIDRGQKLFIKGNAYVDNLELEFADNGERLFDKKDVRLAKTSSIIFERLHESKNAYLSGQENERKRIRRDLHDQIGHNLLSLIYTATDEAARTLAKETMQQLRELIQALKQKPMYIEEALSSLKNIAAGTSERFSLELDWKQFISQPYELQANQYLNIANIVRELLNNTVKYAEATRLCFVISCQRNELKLVIADDGIGFDPDSISMGNGLKNIDSRIKELEGVIEWSRVAGTVATIRIPLNQVS